MTFTNDRYPSARDVPWTCEKTLVCKGASIGAGCVVLCGVTIRENALVGAGTVIVKDVLPGWKIHGYAGTVGTPPGMWLEEAERGTGR